jgi:hypothetical protein
MALTLFHNHLRRFDNTRAEKTKIEPDLTVCLKHSGTYNYCTHN